MNVFHNICSENALFELSAHLPEASELMILIKLLEETRKVSVNAGMTLQASANLC